MKDKIKQIEFIDQKLLPLYKIVSIQDYKSSVSLADIKKIKNIIDDLNALLPEIKELFPVKEFNLHKTNNKIATHTQVYAFLKTCLQIANIPFEITRDNKIASVRLIEKNISLENYIKTIKMSDVRVRDAYMMKSTLSEDQNTDQSGLISCDDLEMGVKKEYQQEYYIPFHKVSLSYDGKSIGINLTRLLKDLNSVTVEIIGNSLLLTSNFIDKTFYGSKYHIDVAGSIYHEGILEKDKNIFPNKKCPMPFSKNLFSQISLVIHCDFSHRYDFLKDNTCIKIITNHVIFKKKMIDRLSNKNYCVEFVNSDTKLTFAQGMVQVYYKKDSPIEKEMSCQKRLNEELEKLGGQEFIVGKYTCYRLKKCSYHDKDQYGGIQGLIPIASGYDICCQELTDVPLNISYYTKNDNIYKFEHTFLRTHDAISNIKIIFPKAIKITKVHIQIMGAVNFWEWPERDIEPDFTYENGNMTVKINLPPNHYLPMSAYGLVLTLEFEDSYDLANYMINSATLSYDALLAETILRQQLMTNNADFILE